ncbi:MAG: hypothetical protein P8098_13400 [Candidatus Thiodiazotropha sp.]
MSSKRMAQRVAGDAFGDTRLIRCNLDLLLDGGLMDMVTPVDAGTRIFGNSTRGKQVLPAQLLIGVRVLTCQGTGQVDTSETGSEIIVMLLSDRFHLGFQGGYEQFRHRHGAIFLSFAASHQDIAVLKVEIEDTQPDTLHDTHPGAIHQVNHQTVHT